LGKAFFSEKRAIIILELFFEINEHLAAEEVLILLMNKRLKIKA